MQPLAFESISKLLLFCHLVAAVTALASSIHLLARLVRAFRSGGRFAPQTKLHATILAASYVTLCVLGGMIYPTFRIRVRHDFLDAAYPWATGLFEIKELLATTALLPVIGVFVFSRAIDLANREHRRYIPAYAGLAAYVLAVLLFNACFGWYLVTLRSV